MADTGASIGSFGGGFAKGLANVLYRNQQQKREDERRAQEKKDELNLKVFDFAMQNDPENAEAFAQTAFPDVFGQVGKPTKVKKGEVSPWQKVRNVLGAFKPHLGMGGGSGAPAPVEMSGGTPAPASQTMDAIAPVRAPPSDTPRPPATTVIPGTGIPVEGTPAAPTATGQAPKQATMFGIRVPSREQQEESKTGIEAKVRIARRMVENGTAKSIDEALDRVGLTDTRGSLASSPYQSVPGTLNGKPAFGVFDRASGKYVDPVTHAVLEGFTPTTASASRTLGNDREALAIQMFGKRASELDQQQMAAVNAALPTFAGTMSEARGMGSGRAKIATELNMPVGATVGAQFNVPPTTPLSALAQANGLTAEQQEKIANIAVVERSITEIEGLLGVVFPNVEPGLWGRLQSQWSLGVQKLNADEDLAQLDAAIELALANVSRLGGQTGVLSNQDIQRAQATLASLEPSLFGGDTLATARARLLVVKNLLSTAKAKTPSRTTPGATGVVVPGAAGAGGGTGTQTAPPNSAAPTAVLKDGKWVLP
jgi:hypothetical protein